MNKLKLSIVSVMLAHSSAYAMSAIPNLSFSHLHTYEEDCGLADGCAEISAYDPQTGKVFTTNAEENELRILQIDNNQFTEVGLIDLSPYGAGPNSVSVYNGKVAVAVENTDKQSNGSVIIFDLDGKEVNNITVGALPDMLTFTPDGRHLLVANEGEPNDTYDFDPEGSISVIDTFTWSVKTADFSAFNQTKPRNMRVFGPNATLAQDVEPEYITVSKDSSTAWISLQENNALAKLDIASATITDLFGLGYKPHKLRTNALDASNEDGGIHIRSWPVFGMYQPDAIASYQVKGKTYIVSANEGDARDYDGFSEEERVKDLTLNPVIYRNAEELQQKANLGRLKITTTKGDLDQNGEYEMLFSYGTRSFSIWSEDGRLVADTGAEFEKRLAKLEANGESVWVDSRSDDKGPEPESITIGKLGGKQLAFIGLERVSGIFVYDISKPARPKFVSYLDIKKFGDIAPEGLVFIRDSYNSGRLLVTSEVSNTVSLYQITAN